MCHVCRADRTGSGSDKVKTVSCKSKTLSHACRQGLSGSHWLLVLQVALSMCTLATQKCSHCCTCELCQAPGGPADRQCTHVKTHCALEDEKQPDSSQSNACHTCSRCLNSKQQQERWAKGVQIRYFSDKQPVLTACRAIAGSFCSLCEGWRSRLRMGSKERKVAAL